MRVSSARHFYSCLDACSVVTASILSSDTMAYLQNMCNELSNINSGFIIEIRLHWDVWHYKVSIDDVPDEFDVDIEPVFYSHLNKLWK
jgi:hypothetical protein